jgi:hypothetical protein
LILNKEQTQTTHRSITLATWITKKERLLLEYWQHRNCQLLENWKENLARMKMVARLGAVNLKDENVIF